MSFSRLMLTTAAFGALALPALATTHATRHHAPAKVHRVTTPAATAAAPAAAPATVIPGTMAPGTMVPGTSGSMAPAVDAKRAMPDAKAGAAVTTPAPRGAPAVATTPAAPGTVRAN